MELNNILPYRPQSTKATLSDVFPISVENYFFDLYYKVRCTRNQACGFFYARVFCARLMPKKVIGRGSPEGCEKLRLFSR
jgi:hypothetical protein